MVCVPELRPAKAAPGMVAVPVAELPLGVRAKVMLPDGLKASTATSALEIGDARPAAPTGGSVKLAVTVTSLPVDVTVPGVTAVMVDVGPTVSVVTEAASYWMNVSIPPNTNCRRAPLVAPFVSRRPLASNTARRPLPPDVGTATMASSVEPAVIVSAIRPSPVDEVTGDADDALPLAEDPHGVADHARVGVPEQDLVPGRRRDGVGARVGLAVDEPDGAVELAQVVGVRSRGERRVHVGEQQRRLVVERVRRRLVRAAEHGRGGGEVRGPDDEDAGEAHGDLARADVAAVEAALRRAAQDVAGLVDVRARLRRGERVRLGAPRVDALVVAGQPGEARDRQRERELPGERRRQAVREVDRHGLAGRRHDRRVVHRRRATADEAPHVRRGAACGDVRRRGRDQGARHGLADAAGAARALSEGALRRHRSERGRRGRNARGGGLRGGDPRGDEQRQPADDGQGPHRASPCASLLSIHPGAVPSGCHRGHLVGAGRVHLQPPAGSMRMRVIIPPKLAP